MCFTGPRRSSRTLLPVKSSVSATVRVLTITCTPGWLLRLHSRETLGERQSVGSLLNPPSQISWLSICFPEIRPLELICIHFEHSKEDFNRILSGQALPVLKELILEMRDEGCRGIRGCRVSFKNCSHSIQGLIGLILSYVKYVFFCSW